MTQKNNSEKIETAICQSKFQRGIMPRVYKERKERWLKATELMRKQKMYILDHFGKRTITKSKDGIFSFNIELPEQMRDMVKYLDEQIKQAADEIIGQGA